MVDLPLSAGKITIDVSDCNSFNALCSSLDKLSLACTLQKVWERFVDVYSILKCMHLENFFHHINNLHQSIKFTIEEEGNGELVFLDTLLKQNNGEISVLLVYRKLTHTDQYLNYSSHHQISCKEYIVSSLFNRPYSIITNKDNLHKENARMKQVLKEN